MIILGIETSCDETAAAVVQKTGNRIKILSNVVASSASIQAKYGGVIPEQAAREQLRSIIPVIEEGLNKAQVTSNKLNAIAITQGPGLIGSLLIGVETAKTLAFLWNKPLIPVNHLLGHFYANWGAQSSVVSRQSSDKTSLKADSEATPKADEAILKTESYPQFPCIGLLVSGGHTDLILFKDHGKYEYLGGTRDDAAGECFDKCARLLGLPYPGGPAIANLASQGDALRFSLPRPMIDSKDFDFSFSGLKTAVANLLKEVRGDGKKGIPARSRSERSRVRMYDGISSRQDPELANFCASIEAAIVDVLVAKTIKAVQTYKVNQIMIAGGVAANQKLVSELAIRCQSSAIRLSVPPPELCTDNAAMIAAAVFYNFHPINPLKLQANPNLSLS
ncbi:MAG: tRNA (adenosine(37)-N6)-threonylcarbamoyltransferase complex transferase subunit TsaD [Candidatus Daviesbacteria bacterium]|nr:tRNA (adenosine(37)-N6)-threonylcarbamoyltransferase complex transferase subunit TsaD [Candidatus Daviesbacteria bacterium]